jgi:hypothetical protein
MSRRSWCCGLRESVGQQRSRHPCLTLSPCSVYACPGTRIQALQTDKHHVMARHRSLSHETTPDFQQASQSERQIATSMPSTSLISSSELEATSHSCRASSYTLTGHHSLFEIGQACHIVSDIVTSFKFSNIGCLVATTCEGFLTLTVKYKTLAEMWQKLENIPSTSRLDLERQFGRIRSRDEHLNERVWGAYGSWSSLHRESRTLSGLQDS